MKAESLGNNEYRLLDNTGNNIGSINLDGFLKREAKANFNGKFILFKPKGFLSQTMQVFENDNEIASIHMDFFSKIKIQFTDGKEIILKAKGFWNKTLVYYNTHNTKILEINPIFKWGKFATEYVIHILDEAIFSDVQILIICFYAGTYLYKNLGSD